MYDLLKKYFKDLPSLDGYIYAETSTKAETKAQNFYEHSKHKNIKKTVLFQK